MNFEKFVPSVEINSIKQNINVKNEGVEIFSAICNGKDITKYGKKVDQVMAYMKNLGEKALAGDTKAMAEVNAIREIQIQAPLLKRLNLFNYMGDYQNVGYNEELRYKVYQLQGKKAGEQANSGSFPFATHTWREGTFGTTTITGGIAVDYREVATGNTDAIAVANEQVITDMMNQMFYIVIANMYNSINAIAVANGLTAFSENAGIVRAAVDDAIRLIRRWGSVTISGDYSVISQLEAFMGFDITPANPAGTVQYSEAVMEEIRKTGLLKNYRGVPVVEIPNGYNLTRINATGGIGNTPYYDTYLPEGLMFLTPKTGYTSPLQVGIKGGVTSMAGQDINLRLNVQRFDMEFGKLNIAA
jgi:hypothetical protein